MIWNLLYLAAGFIGGYLVAWVQVLEIILP